MDRAESAIRQQWINIAVGSVEKTATEAEGYRDDQASEEVRGGSVLVSSGRGFRDASDVSPTDVLAVTACDLCSPFSPFVVPLFVVLLHALSTIPAYYPFAAWSLFDSYGHSTFLYLSSCAFEQ